MSRSSVPPDVFRDGSGFGFDRGRSIPETDPMVTDPRFDQGATTGGQQTSNLSKAYDSDSFSDLYASAAQSRVDTPVQMDVDVSPPTSTASGLDLVNRVKGMYRILDLISEQGSGGLVAKIVIAQESLRAFINTISPNSYSATTKVNFQALDKLALKPMGIYGNKEEIATFFIELGIVDRATFVAELLCKPHDTAEVDEPVLRSGLYIVRSAEIPQLQEQVFVVFWPEDTTWNDSAASSVRRNRVTFMRYLTKVADQVSALISPSHASRFVWNEDNHDDPVDAIEDEDIDVYEESGRLFTYQVAKTNEQEESVTARPGFAPPDSPVDPSVPMAQLLPGETVQGLMTSTFILAKKIKMPLPSSMQNETQIRHLIEANAIGLAEDLTIDALDILAKLGLKPRFPQACKAWIEGKGEIIRVVKDRGIAKNMELSEQLDLTLPQLKADVRDAVVAKVTRLYPFFAPEEQEPPEDPSQVEPESEGSKERLENLASLYPRMTSALDKAIRDVKLETIKAHKDRDASAARSRLFTSVLDAKDNRAVRKILEDFTPEKEQATDSKSSFWSSLNPFSSKESHSSSYAESLLKEAERITSEKTDSEFLARLDTFTFGLDDKGLLSKINETKGLAQEALRKSIAHVLKTLPHTVLAIQQEDCRRQIEMELASEQQMAIDEARLEFIRMVNQMTQSSFSDRIFINHIETSRTSWGTQGKFA
ncbi:hypothetical protein EWM64_g5494 [Hericium alpestre]|uniref:Uncharacterized protein n=1 Tax=Hericium alpestre TaxID=135208 RepID=A0A4Y9ZWJ4_9AGAM|nr:hypothetical protein EWM64_g5494 [Hericium alpestre]